MTDNPFASPLPKDDLPLTPEIIDVELASEDMSGLTAILIVCLILGATGLLGSLIGIAGLAVQTYVAEFQSGATDPNAVKIQEIQESQVVPNLILMVLNLFVAPLLLTGSIAGLMRKKWAPRLLRIGLISAVVFVSIRSVVTAILQYSAIGAMRSIVEQQTANSAREAALVNGFMSAGMIIGIAYAIFFAILFIVFYLWAWTYMNSDKVRRHFDLPVVGS